ncbi:hypothetical protein Cgig2_029694 [Carnegiea gigantea]|uniref:Uncharacterized protein n=1 Tax=Carnegiea gigantea TaxID=171969 RepID=A0A9Q1KH72_9CARY|nr:hypothetical protein Cgig2_029694 [Carnegiea gigantea]
MMFTNTCATSKHSWDPYTLQVNEEGEVVEKKDNIEGVILIKIKYSGHDDYGGTNLSLENIEIETVNVVEQKGKKKQKKSSSTEGTGKATKKNKSKVSTASYIQSQLDCTMEAVERCVSYFSATSISSDLPGMYRFAQKLFHRGSGLYVLDARLFIKKQYNEMFIALEDDDVRVSWLEYEVRLIK